MRRAPGLSDAAGDTPGRSRYWVAGRRRRPLYEHLAETCEQLWIAEDDGRPIGYACSILRDGVRELTELFVVPDLQSTADAGREMRDLERVLC